MSLSDNKLVYLLRHIWFYAGEARPRLALIYVLYILANALYALQPIALAQIINAAQAGGPDALHSALLWSAAYGGVTIAFWSLHGPARVIERRTAFIAYHNFITDLYRKVTEMPLRWHQDHHSGNTINRINKAGRALYSFGQGQFVTFQTGVRFTISITVLAWLSWWVALVSVIVSGIIFLIISRFDKILIPLVLKNNEREHHLNAALYDYIGNIVTVLTLRLQSNTMAEIEHRFGAMQPSFWKETLTNEQKWAIVNILLVTSQVMIVGAYISVHLLRGEALQIGAVVAMFQYLIMILNFFFSAMVVHEDLTYKQIDMRGIEPLIEDHARLAGTRQLDEARPWRDIRISGLTFTHREGEDKFHTLHDVALSMQAGKNIAFIGTSGSGKTTLLTLLRGMYEAQSVRLTLDDVQFDSLSPLSVFTTLVPQDSEIFENTVRYNLTLNTEVPEQIIREALSVSTFDEVASDLPEGIYTDIRERGINLSGGQKQRLALARGLIAARTSSLMLLDEPTSSVDLATEARIFDRLFVAYKDKTIVASIHRLHLLPRFDHICVMKNGTITEQGSFSALLAANGEFSQLWRQHLVQENAP